MSYKVGVTTACLEIWGMDLGSCSVWRKTRLPTKHTWVKFVQDPDHIGEYSAVTAAWAAPPRGRPPCAPQLSAAHMDVLALPAATVPFGQVSPCGI